MGEIIGELQEDLHKITQKVDENNKEENDIYQNGLINSLLDSIPDLVFYKDVEGVYLGCNTPFAEFVGSPREKIIGKTDYDLFDDNTAAFFRENDKTMLAKKKHRQNEEWVTYPDGRYILLDTLKTPYWGQDGQLVGILGVSRDITEKKKMEEIIFNEKERFKTTLLSVGDGIISIDNQGSISMMNPMAEQLTGWSQEEAIGKSLEGVFNTINELTKLASENHINKVLKNGETVKRSNHTLLISKNGVITPIEDTAAPIKNRDGQITGAVIVLRDISENKEKQKQIRYLSFHDYITGLYNRRYMEDATDRLDNERNLPFSIMVLDVNGLKLTNDAFGHEMGDKLLLTVASILRDVCRANDIIGRMGGDEFLILLPQTDGTHAEKIKRRIIAATAKTKLDSVIVSLAIGYSVKTNKDENIENIKMNADNSMYKDKLKYGKTMRSQTIETVLRNINFKYDQEQIHTERVSQYCEAITIAMNLSKREVHDSKIAGGLHDVGKIMVPPELLNKPGKLTEEEFEVIKRHPETGYQILKTVDEYAALAEVVLYHHERWDGTGYPEGLNGEKIPLLSRIIAVADAYEAMTAKRPYQKSKTKEDAKAELVKCSGTQFDPYIVKLFVEKVL